MASNNADFGCTFFVKQANGQPYDLTGAVLEMSIKNKPGATAQATFSTTGPSSNLAIRARASAGIVDLAVPFMIMAGLSAGTYFWDLLLLASGTSHIFLGGGTWLVTQGITESATPALPAPQPFFAAAGSDIQLGVGNSALQLSLAPSGPPGTGASFAAQATPGAPATGFLVYCDEADGLLKAISYNGNITDLALP
jgi:hypothetical protein